MTTKLKILGQSNPSGNTLTTVYTVPSLNSAIVSSIVVCNTGTNNATFSLAIVPSGLQANTNSYIAFNTTVPSYDTIHLTMGISMGANDRLQANVLTSNISVNLFGTEVY